MIKNEETKRHERKAVPSQPTQRTSQTPSDFPLVPMEPRLGMREGPAELPALPTTQRSRLSDESGGQKFLGTLAKFARHPVGIMAIGAIAKGFGAQGTYGDYLQGVIKSRQQDPYLSNMLSKQGEIAGQGYDPLILRTLFSYAADPDVAMSAAALEEMASVTQMPVFSTLAELRRQAPNRFAQAFQKIVKASGAETIDDLGDYIASHPEAMWTVANNERFFRMLLDMGPEDEEDGWEEGPFRGPGVALAYEGLELIRNNRRSEVTPEQFDAIAKLANVNWSLNRSPLPVTPGSGLEKGPWSYQFDEDMKNQAIGDYFDTWNQVMSGKASRAELAKASAALDDLGIKDPERTEGMKRYYQERGVGVGRQ